MSKNNLKIGVPFTFLMIILNTVRLFYVFLGEDMALCRFIEVLFSSGLLYVVDILYIAIALLFDRRKFTFLFLETFFNIFLLIHVYVGFQVGLDSFTQFNTFTPFNISVFLVFLLFNVKPIESSLLIVIVYVVLNFFRGTMQIPDSEYWFEGVYSFSIMIVSVLRYYSERRIIRNQIRNEEINLRLQDISQKDQLTGLYNRHALTMDMKDVYDKGLMLIMFDLDDFKKVNDDYGHEVGDELIKEFGRELQRSFVGNKVYRYGGDEFLVLKTCPKEEKISSEILSKLNSILVEPMKQSIKTSCGFIFGIPHNYEDYLNLLKEADDCLYKDKRSRKRKDFTVSLL